MIPDTRIGVSYREFEYFQFIDFSSLQPVFEKDFFVLLKGIAGFSFGTLDQHTCTGMSAGVYGVAA